MKNLSKILLIAVFCIGAALTFFCRTTVYDKYPDNTTHSEKSDTAGKSFPAATLPNSDTEKFILMYNAEDSDVVLITKKTDGSEIISSVKEVNPFFLTDKDLEKLSRGIEISSKEELFMLIEDLSS